MQGVPAAKLTPADCNWLATPAAAATTRALRERPVGATTAVCLTRMTHPPCQHVGLCTAPCTTHPQTHTCSSDACVAAHGHLEPSPQRDPLDGCHCGLWPALQQAAYGRVDAVVDAAAPRLVLELVDVKACAEVGA